MGSLSAEEKVEGGKSRCVLESEILGRVYKQRAASQSVWLEDR